MPTKAIWRFDSETLDSFGSNHGRALNYTDNPFVAGKINDGITFDGINDYFLIPDTPDFDVGTGAYALSFWFKTAIASDGRRVIFSKIGTSGFGFNVYLRRTSGSTNLIFRNDNGADAVVDSNDYDDNVWRHALVGRDATGNAWIFVNGVQTATETGLTENIDNTIPVTIGYTSDGTPHFYEGELDQIEWMPGTTPDATLALDLYNQGVAGKSNPEDPTTQSFTVGYSDPEPTIQSATVAYSDPDPTIQAITIAYTVPPNSPPTLGTVTIDTANLYTSTTNIDASITSFDDADDNPITLTWELLINDVVQVGSTISGSRTVPGSGADLTENIDTFLLFSVGDVVKVRVTADDGTNPSVSSTSVGVAVQNTAPFVVNQNLIINAVEEQPFLSDLQEYQDQDGDDLNGSITSGSKPVWAIELTPTPFANQPTDVLQDITGVPPLGSSGTYFWQYTIDDGTDSVNATVTINVAEKPIKGSGGFFKRFGSASLITKFGSN